jgi:sigma-B regulation protein RsbU (phosphoserine phosphatase)
MRVENGGRGIRSLLEGGLDSFLLDHVGAAVLATELDGVIRHWNRHAEEMLGFSAAEAFGKTIPELDLLHEQEQQVEEMLKHVAAGDSWERDLRLRHKDGRLLWTHITLSSIRDAAGTTRGAVAVAFDITQRRRAEERLALQYEVTSILSESDRLEDAVPRLLQAVCERLGWRFGALWQPTGDRTRIRCVEAWADPRFQLSEFRRVTMEYAFEKGEGLPGRAWQSGEPSWIPDVVADTNFPRGPVASALELHAGFAFPFIVRGGIEGVFEFFHDEVIEPDNELIDLTRALGRQLGQFIVREEAVRAASITRARRSAIVDSAFDCLISMDASGQVVEFNPAAEETFGYRRDDVLGRALADFIPDLREERSGLGRSVEAGMGSIMDKRIEMTAVRADGSTFPAEVAITKIDAPDELLFTVYLRDITDRRRFEEAVERLLENERNARQEAEQLATDLNNVQRLTDVALSHLDLDDLLDELLDRLTEILHSDSLGILFTSEDGSELHLRAQRGLDVDLSKHGTIPTGDGIAGKIAESESSIVIDDVVSQTDHEPYIGIGDTRSIVGVPMHLERHLLGVLMAGSSEPHYFNVEHVRLLELAADRIAFGISNAREYTREHRIAVTLQRSLLPEALPSVPGVSIAARHLAGGPETMVGGDWYDASELPGGRVGLVVGDVAGKGVKAAASMGQIRSALVAIGTDSPEPRTAVTRLNRLMHRIGTETLATLVYLVFDPAAREVCFTNAGHPPPLIRTPDGSALYLHNDPSPPLGVAEQTEYEEWVTTLESGSEVLLYTDGLIERPASSIVQGMELLRSALTGAPHEVEGLCDAVLRHVFAEQDPTDDVAVVALRFD